MIRKLYFERNTWEKILKFVEIKRFFVSMAVIQPIFKNYQINKFLRLF